VIDAIAADLHGSGRIVDVLETRAERVICVASAV
jgi:hypothetical protein